MKHEEFDLRVQKIDQRYQDRPEALKRRVLFLALAGYAGFFASFALVAGLSALFIVPAFVWPKSQWWWLSIIGVLILIYAGGNVIRLLWVRLEPPEGRALTPKEAPKLFEILSSLRKELDAPAFYRVLLSPECNASVCEVARLGVFGWPRHYLQIGLPLLESMPVEELRTVLAHEYAHLSRRDGRVSAWIYRLRRTWVQVFEELQSRPRVNGEVSFQQAVLFFIQWFWPRFNSHAFVLSRANEFKADATAARLAGADHCVNALFRVNLVGQLLSEKFWPELWQEAKTSAEQPAGVFLQLRDRLRAAPPEESATWRSQAFQSVTSTEDTHPCLSTRMRALGQLPPGIERGEYPEWPAPPRPSAAEELLGENLDKAREDVEALWRKDSAKAWTDAHACAAVLKDRLTQIDAVASGKSVSELWERVEVVGRLEGDEAAAPLLREILARQPNHALANFHLGRHLLNENDDEGENHMERAMAEDDDAVPIACEYLLHYVHRVGRSDLIAKTKARLDRHATAVAAAQLEFNQVTASDTFIAHGLTDAELASVIEVLRADSSVSEAYLAQKQMKHSQKQRLFMLSVRSRRSWYGMSKADLDRAIANRLITDLRLPGRKLVVTPNGGFRGIAKKVMRLPGAEIFKRANG